MRLFLSAAAGALLFGCSSMPAVDDTPKEIVIDQSQLETDVRVLADDDMRGREAGTEDYDRAADYVVGRFKELGLKPGGVDGTYFQPIPFMASKSSMPFGGSMSITREGETTDFQGGVDSLVGSGARNESVTFSAPVVFAGYGFVSEEHGRNDYEGVDVEGKVVATFSGAPKFLNSEERAHYGSVRNKTASELGAIGNITLITPEFEENRLSFERIVSIIDGRTNLSWLDEDGLPFTQAPNFKGGAFLSQPGAKKLFEGQPVSYEELATQAETEQGDMQAFDMGLTVNLTAGVESTTLESSNVIGLIPGTDRKLKNEYVVVTAHLDHTGVGLNFATDDNIYNGAMDNATGVASILEVARQLNANPPKRSVLFIALTAEEKGLLGSDYFARNPTVPADKIVANVNLDMPIVTYDFQDIVAYGAERSTLWPIVEAAAERAGLSLSPDPAPEQGFFTRSDQYSFVKQGYPAVSIDPGWAGEGKEQQGIFLSKHYHQPSDQVELVNFDALAKFAKVNTEIAMGIANMPERPVWKKGDFFGRIFEGPMEK